jgi:hypothetical protein
MGLPFRLVLAVGAMGVAGTVMIVQKIDHSMNYVPATASITDVKASCYLQKVERGVLTKTTETTDKMNCERAEELRSSHPAYEGMKVKGMMDVSFEYISPVDQLQHDGELTYSYEDYAPLAQASSGTELPILVSKSDPNKNAHDYDRMAEFATPAS